MSTIFIPQGCFSDNCYGVSQESSLHCKVCQYELNISVYQSFINKNALEINLKDTIAAVIFAVDSSIFETYDCVNFNRYLKSILCSN